MGSGGNEIGKIISLYRTGFLIILRIDLLAKKIIKDAS